MAVSLKRFFIGRNPRRTLMRLGILIVVTVLLFRFVFAALRLDGISMEPSYHHGEISLVNRLAYLNSGPERGDVVAVRMRNTGRSIFLLKRVVGLPGEAVGFERGLVTIDGVRLKEDYLSYDSDWERDPVRCEANEYFVVGDNRSMPIEQHTLGRTTLSRIVGKLIF